MKQTFLVTVDVDDCKQADVAKDIEKAIMATDGEQHLELMNWEPIPIKVVEIKLIIDAIPNDVGGIRRNVQP